MVLPLITFFWMTAGIVIAFSMPPAQALKATPAAFFHVPMAIAMEMGFIVAAGYGIAWLITRKNAYDARSVAFAEVGFAFGLVALVTGSVWAKINWNSYWSWDPQQVGIVATLLTYAALFALRGATEDTDRARLSWAVYAILGVISAIFWTFVFRHLATFSLHPSKTISSSGSNFRMALWFNIIGYTLLICWVASLRTRIILLQEALHNRQMKEMEWVSN